jgi:hypothetical protein
MQNEFWYVLSRDLIFATIPKACGFEAATRFTSTRMGGSLIPIVVIGMGMALTWLNTYEFCLICYSADFSLSRRYERLECEFGNFESTC